MPSRLVGWRGMLRTDKSDIPVRKIPPCPTKRTTSGRRSVAPAPPTPRRKYRNTSPSSWPVHLIRETRCRPASPKAVAWAKPGGSCPPASPLESAKTTAHHLLHITSRHQTSPYVGSADGTVQDFACVRQFDSPVFRDRVECFRMCFDRL